MATDDEDEGDSNKTSRPLTDSSRNKPLITPPGDQKVSPIPDVTIHMRNHERDEYVVVACDGIWDVVSNQQCVNELDEIMYAEGERDLGLVSEEILDTCLRYGSKDNMTTIVVQLPGCEKSYDEAARKASEEAGRETTDDSKTTIAREGVTGRRRKREEAMSAAQQQQQSGGGSPNYAEATQYGGSAPE
jgi:serine/threonine protein phosphatase PrpC